MAIILLHDRCTGCGLCQTVCPYNAIEIKEGRVEFNEGCTLCGSCIKTCPFGAITVSELAPTFDRSPFKGIWVIAEETEGRFRRITFELLSKAQELAKKLGEEVAVVAIGSHEISCEDLGKYGANRVYLVRDEQLGTYDYEAYTQVLTSLIQEYRPAIVLFGGTHQGRDLAPRVASRLRTGLTADCTGLDISPEGLLLQIRPTFGGNIMAWIVCPHRRPQMATVRPNVIELVEPKTEENLLVEVLRPVVGFSRSEKVRLLESVKEVSEFCHLEEADVIVAGGYGLGKAENFEILKELARILKASLAASRAAVDAGWISQRYQVGQTGKTVSPRLYIACGISGAIHHLIGMQKSRRIVAINKDPNASICKIADLVLVGDAMKIVPALTRSLAKYMKE